MLGHRSYVEKNTQCICGHAVVAIQPCSETGFMYWWQCSDKNCEHHQGEETPYMNAPEWVVPMPGRKKENEPPEGIKVGLKKKLFDRIDRFVALGHWRHDSDCINVFVSDLRQLLNEDSGHEVTSDGDVRL